MRKICFLFLVAIFLSGCQTSKTFSTYEKAVEYGLKDEGITKGDIVDEMQVNSEKFVIYAIPNSDGDSIGIANVGVDKNGSYIWYSAGSKVNIVAKNSDPKKSIPVQGEIQSKAGKKFIVNLGSYKTKQDKITDQNDEVLEPRFDERRMIYYIIRKK